MNSPFCEDADVRVHDVVLPMGDYRLAATLWMPAGLRPHPAVALLHGAGPGVRSDYIAPVREAFSHGGLAVLAWDRPGCGESTGDWRRQTLEDRADEALAAIGFLNAHPELASERIGLWGQSQGANVAALAAAHSSNVAFVAATSPAGITLADLQCYGLERSLRADGTSDEQIQAAIACVRMIQDADRRGDTYEQLETTALAPARSQPWGRYFTSPPLPDVETWRYWRSRGGLPDQNLDPVPIWEHVNCPVLAMWGGRDVVMPVSDVVARTQAALLHNRDISIRVFADAGHGMEIIGTHQPAPGYLEHLVSWTRARVGLT
jgi:uncharacterized protein